MKKLKLDPVCLGLFGENAQASIAEQTAETPAQDMQETAREDKISQNKGSSAESKKAQAKIKHAEFKKMVKGEYKDEFSNMFQKTFNRRFKGAKENEEKIAAQTPIISALAQQFGLDEGNTEGILDALLSLGVEAKTEQKAQMPQTQEIEQEPNEDSEDIDILAEWSRELEKSYAEADLATELENEDFTALLKAGVPVSSAYEVVHLDAIKQQVAREAAEKAIAQTVEGIRTRGMRVQENGILSQNGVTVKTDVSKLTPQERQLLALRSLKGEEIIL